MDKFQNEVGAWTSTCFGEMIDKDVVERNHRFLEEALELVQACGDTRGNAHQLVDYVFDRPIGEKAQEVGGVLVTLAALCNAQELLMSDAATNEIARCWTKVEKIREKQANKPQFGPLAEASDTSFLTEAMQIVVKVAKLNNNYDMLPAEVEQAKQLVKRMGHEVLGPD